MDILYLYLVFALVLKFVTSNKVACHRGQLESMRFFHSQWESIISVWSLVFLSQSRLYVLKECFSSTGVKCLCPKNILKVFWILFLFASKDNFVPGYKAV